MPKKTTPSKPVRRKTSRKKAPRKKAAANQPKTRTSANGAAVKGEGPAPEPISPDALPFDADFFREHFPNLLPPDDGSDTVELPPRSFVVTVVLGDGMVQYDVSHIERLGPLWALMVVYDEDNYRDGTVANRYVFMPYAAIARVEVTGLERRLRPIGFNNRPKPEAEPKKGRKTAAKKRVARKKAVTKKRVTKKKAARKKS